MSRARGSLWSVWVSAAACVCLVGCPQPDVQPEGTWAVTESAAPGAPFEWVFDGLGWVSVSSSLFETAGATFGAFEGYYEVDGQEVSVACTSSNPEELTSHELFADLEFSPDGSSFTGTIRFRSYDGTDYDEEDLIGEWETDVAGVRNDD